MTSCTHTNRITQNEQKLFLDPLFSLSVHILKGNIFYKISVNEKAKAPPKRREDLPLEVDFFWGGPISLGSQDADS